MQITITLDIDFELLKKQKHDLLKLANKYQSIWGIVHLIDEIQDQAVDECGIDEDMVFNLAEKE